ncbi:MAG: RibD family protein [Archangium sp.]
MKPDVICHMVSSVDGRIVADRWPEMGELTKAYERTAKTLKGDAWIIGRVSMEPYAGNAKVPTKTSVKLPRTDFIATRADGYAIGIDPSGKLRWEENNVDGEHFVSVLTEQVSDAYLAFLREKGVSYVFGGKKAVNLERVLEKLNAHFGIKRLLLEGGGKINGSFLEAGLVDELSLIVAPLADGSVGNASVFDAGPKRTPRRLQLRAMKRLPGGLAWLRYDFMEP